MEEYNSCLIIPFKGLCVKKYVNLQSGSIDYFVDFTDVCDLSSQLWLLSEKQVKKRKKNRHLHLNLLLINQRSLKKGAGMKDLLLITGERIKYLSLKLVRVSDGHRRKRSEPNSLV